MPDTRGRPALDRMIAVRCLETPARMAADVPVAPENFFLGRLPKKCYSLGSRVRGLTCWLHGHRRSQQGFDMPKDFGNLANADVLGTVRVLKRLSYRDAFARGWGGLTRLESIHAR